MELKSIFLPQIQPFSPSSSSSLPPVRRTERRRPMIVCVLGDSSPSPSFPFRESFPVSYKKWKAIEDHYNNFSRSAQLSLAPTSGNELDPDPLVPKRAFGQYVAREAELNAEYWVAAWLRAEAHYESLNYMRNVELFKKSYADETVACLVIEHYESMRGDYLEEHKDLVRRCSGRDGNSLKCFCFVTVKEEDKHVKRTIKDNVVGTLDLSIRQFLHSETFPGEYRRYSVVLASPKAHDAHKYAYIANLCVSKSSRRQGIAFNMMHLATELAVTLGMKQLFVHVNIDNKPAQELYRKAGFEMVETASSSSTPDQRLLLHKQF